MTDDISRLDPDWDAVDELLGPQAREHDGQRVIMWVDGQPPLEGTLVIIPSIFGDARRMAEGDMPPGPSAN